MLRAREIDPFPGRGPHRVWMLDRFVSEASELLVDPVGLFHLGHIHVANWDEVAVVGVPAPMPVGSRLGRRGREDLQEALRGENLFSGNRSDIIAITSTAVLSERLCSRSGTINWSHPRLAVTKRCHAVSSFRCSESSMKRRTRFSRCICTNSFSSSSLKASELAR